MENIVDNDRLKFIEGSHVHFLVERLIQMNYYQMMTQMMDIGSYGLAQFRLRFFLWGAHYSEVKIFFDVVYLYSTNECMMF